MTEFSFLETRDLFDILEIKEKKFIFIKHMLNSVQIL